MPQTAGPFISRWKIRRLWERSSNQWIWGIFRFVTDPRGHSYRFTGQSYLDWHAALRRVIERDKYLNG